MHAIIAFIVIGLLVLGVLLNDIPEAYQHNAYELHKSFGITVLFLMLIRIGFIIKDGRPKLPNSVARWEKILSRLVQYLLYLTLILMPMSGWIMEVASDYTPTVFGLFDANLPFIPHDKKLADFFNSSHYYLAWLIGGLLTIHFLGGLKHYFVDKDGVFQRMWRFRK
jgi:cytochrome b561